MNGLDRKIPIADAMDAEARAADWLQRQHFWNWSAEDQAGLDTWLGQSLAHRLAYWRLEAAWGRTERLAALRSSAPEPAAPVSRKRSWSFAIATAVVAIAALGVTATAYVLSPKQTIYETPLGGHQIVALTDGSRIELNTDTVLRAGARQAVLLKGEAYFQIRHDAAHPFVVLAGTHRITDLGTKFLVRRDADRLEVALTEGSARIDSPEGVGQASKLLVPGDVVIATANSLSVTKRPAADLTNVLSWRRGVLVFKYATLADAAAEFNRYNREKLVVADAAAARLTIVGTFRANDVAAFTGLAQEVFRVRVEKRGDEIVISR